MSNEKNVQYNKKLIQLPVEKHNIHLINLS